jgi:hypothetical protein
MLGPVVVYIAKGGLVDEIGEAFKNVSVQDFVRDTSAIAEQRYGDDFKESTRGDVAFDRFVDGCILTSRTAAARPGDFRPWSVLHNAEMQRTFTPDDDETIVDYAHRLHREAKAMNATWFFTAIMSCGRAYNSDEPPDPVDANDPEQLQAALERGELEVCICWYAEKREEEEGRHRAGIIGFTDDGYPSTGIEGDIDPDKNPFHHVLAD